MKIRIANKKRFVIVSSLILVLLISIGIGFKFFYDIQNPEKIFEPTKEEKEEETYDVNDQFDKNKVNILIFGLDKNEYRDKVAKYGVYRSDTIMLATLDFKENTIDIVSLPRDTYVPIYNTRGKDKINSSFAYGSMAAKSEDDVIPTGIEYLSETVSDVLGDIPINYYVGLTDMDVVTKIIDELGGIEIDVLHTLYADKGKDKSKVQVEKGVQELNGKDLLYYARYRAYPLGDIDRVASQQHIMKSLMSSLKSTNSLIKLPKIYNLVSNNMATNLNVKQISALSLFGAKVEKEALNTVTLPGDFGELGGISYWIMNQQKRVALIEELYGINAKVMKQDPKSDKLTTLTARVDQHTMQVGERTKLTISGKTESGKTHSYDVKETKFSVSKNNIIQINEDNTVLAKSQGNVTLNLSVEGIRTTVAFTITPKPVPEPEPNTEPEPEPEPVIKDTTAPVLSGVNNVTIEYGQAFDPKLDVTIKDNDPDAKWSVEGIVNINKQGKYTLTYTAWDTANNRTTVPRVITVLPPPPTDIDSDTDTVTETDEQEVTPQQ